jgi:hypothetical protein
MVLGRFSNKQLELANMVVDKQGRIWDATTGGLVSYSQAQDRLRRMFPRFRMELLSVMFFGMNLQGVYKGLVGPALELAGVQDVLSTALGVTFLPIALATLDILLQLWDWYDKLPEPVKNLVMVLVVLVGILGTLLMWIGLLGLGIQGIATLFGTGALAGAIEALSGFIGGLIGIGIAPLIAIILVVLALFANWEGTLRAFGNFFTGLFTAVFNEVAGILNVFIGLVKLVAGVFVGAFTGDWKMAAEGARQILDGLKQFFIDGFLKMAMLPLQFMIDFLEAIRGGFAKILDWLGLHFINDWVGAFADAGKKAIDAIVNAIKGGAKWVWDALCNIPVIGDFLKGAGGAVGGIAKAIGGILPHFQMGGVMPYTGLAMLHAGERITPAGATSYYSPTINVYASVSSDIDIRNLATRLGEYWRMEMAR